MIKIQRKNKEIFRIGQHAYYKVDGVKYSGQIIEFSRNTVSIYWNSARCQLTYYLDELEELDIKICQ